MKVAILDDNISFCKSLENYLSKYHFDISIYTNYNDLKNHIDSFELLFLDIEMPNISGIDIAQSLSYKHLDIIFISSHDEMIKKCFNRNVVGFVEKSHLEEIDDIICRIIKKEHLTIIKDGKESTQGIGYLDDGTMIVVEGGRKFIGEEIFVIVTSVLQTSAGRMIFAKPKDN